jgi:hypothetical protein
MRFVAAAYVMVASVACSAAREPAPEISLCQVLAAPSTYDGKLITLRASVESDGRHLTLLTDATCSGSGVGLVVENEIAGGEAATAISKAIAEQRFGAPSKQITGTFTGTFRLHAGEVPSRVLLTRAITDVQIVERGSS